MGYLHCDRLCYDPADDMAMVVEDMLIARIPNATRVIGKTQGYLGLPLRDEVRNTTVDGPATRCMVTAWEPTPDELERLNAGASVHVVIVGTQHPPIMLEVGTT